MDTEEIVHFEESRVFYFDAITLWRTQVVAKLETSEKNTLLQLKLKFSSLKKSSFHQFFQAHSFEELNSSYIAESVNTLISFMFKLSTFFCQ